VRIAALLRNLIPYLATAPVSHHTAALAVAIMARPVTTFAIVENGSGDGLGGTPPRRTRR